MNAIPDWKTHGLRIIRSGELNANTPQTPGMTRAEAISHCASYSRYAPLKSVAAYSPCDCPPLARAGIRGVAVFPYV
jgi:uncharacterized RmlC-like cupin family protein